MSKPVIGLIANDISNGLSFQRGHLFLRHLRKIYDFKCYDTNSLTHSDMFYLDGAIFFHPCSDEQMRVIQRLRQHYQIPVVVDVDDLISDLPVDHPEYVLFKNNKVEACMLNADHVTVSTEYLKNRYGHLNSNISVIKNSIDERRFERFKNSPKPYKTGFTVGWSGSQSHRPDLNNTGFIDGLSKFMDEFPDTRAFFHLLCSEKLTSRFGSRIIFNSVPCDYLDYPSMVFTYPIDVMCVPLQDHPFNRAKSDLRLLDMAPFDIPVIASPLEPYLEHGVEEILTPRVCTTAGNLPEDWYAALRTMYESKLVRETLAENAKKYVLTERRSVDQAQVWHSLLQQLLQKEGTRQIECESDPS